MDDLDVQVRRRLRDYGTVGYENYKERLPDAACSRHPPVIPECGDTLVFGTARFYLS